MAPGSYENWPASGSGDVSLARPDENRHLKLWRCSGRREPWSGGVELAERVEFAEAPFGGGGQVGLDDGEVGEPLDGPPASS
jgi:hypothetical protein